MGIPISLTVRLGSCYYQSLPPHADEDCSLQSVEERCEPPPYDTRIGPASANELGVQSFRQNTELQYDCKNIYCTTLIFMVGLDDPYTFGWRNAICI